MQASERDEADLLVADRDLRPPWWRRPWLAAGLLLAAYLLLSLPVDDAAYLSTDTGGKVITLEHLTSGDGLEPDIGYWAETWDPDGEVHPYWYTHRYGDQWVQLSTLPMTYAAVPLYAAFGYTGALLLPMVGGVAAALAARSLARRLGADDARAWQAFWLVGLASPVAIYALDFWEHTVGVALMGWAVVHLLDTAEDDGARWHAAVAGLLFGVAATMRSEAMVYATVAVLATGVVLLRRRQVGRAVAMGVVAGASAAIPVVLNALVERQVLTEAARGERSARVVGRGGEELALRAREAVVTSASPLPSTGSTAIVTGLLLLGLLVVVALAGRRRRDAARARVAATAAGAIYLARALSGLGFVPGLTAANPVAVPGGVLAWARPRRALVAGIALGALPLVWAFQFTGGAAPQWAGRYVLVTGFLLGVLGVVSFDELLPWVRRAFVVLAVAVTAFGWAWVVVRTGQMADAQRALAGRSEAVLVSEVAHLAREGGPTADGRRWLTAIEPETQQLAADVVAQAGLASFALIDLGVAPDLGAAPEFDGWEATEVGFEPLFDDVDLRITTYERAG